METLQNNNETLKEMQGVGKAQALWKRVEKMIFAKEFEETLFAKLGVKRVPHMKRTFQFLSDTAGYTKDSLVLSSNSGKVVMTLRCCAYLCCGFDFAKESPLQLEFRNSK